MQAWEYVPLGPFLGKSFATSISAWVAPLAALGNARVAAARAGPRTAGLLRIDRTRRLRVDLAVTVNGGSSLAGFASMYWPPPQILAHMTVNGA